MASTLETLADLDDVIRRHRTYVRASLTRFGVCQTELDDAEQEVFLVLVRRRNDFDPASSYRRWLWGISRNVALTWRRRERTRSTAPAAEPSVRPPVEERVHVREIIHALDEHQRRVWLARAEGRTAEEIARSMHVPLTTIQWRIRTAKERVRALVSEAGRRCRAIAVWLRASVPSVSTASASLSGVLLLALSMGASADTPDPKWQPMVAGLRVSESPLRHPPPVVLPHADVSMPPISRQGIVSDDELQIERSEDPTPRRVHQRSRRHRREAERARGEVTPLEPSVVRMPTLAAPPSLRTPEGTCTIGGDDGRTDARVECPPTRRFDPRPPDPS